MKLSQEFEKQLRAGIRGMTRKSRLYRILKAELAARGHWKNLPRGLPSRGHFYARVIDTLPDENRLE